MAPLGGWDREPLDFIAEGMVSTARSRTAPLPTGWGDLNWMIHDRPTIRGVSHSPSTP